MVYPEQFEEKIGFDQIRTLLANQCETNIGADICLNEQILLEATHIRTRLQEVSELTEILIEKKEFPDLAPVDVRSSVAKGIVAGTFLDITEWIDIRSVLTSIRQLIAFFKRKESSSFEALIRLVSPIQYTPIIHEKLDLIFSKKGVVRDKASSALKEIRTDMLTIERSIGGRMDKIIAEARQEGLVEKDVQPALREGRLVIPLPVTHKRKIKGLIHDESATGKTAFVEPVELVELNNELRDLEFAERREIIRILTELTEFFRPYFPEIEEWNKIIGRLDMIRSKARLTIRWNGSIPEITDEPVLDWLEAKHPLLFIVFSRENRKVVSQDIHLDKEKRILIISGPNAGGKSVCLKTAGLVQYMIQFGQPPPFKEGSVSGVFSRFLIDIGDEQSIENDLSTYSSHLFHMKQFLKLSGPDTLFLMDEFGAGTEPQLGGAIAESILKQLVATQAFGVITTHYANLKHFAALNDGVVNGAMLFDTQQMKPLFRLDIGKPGSSFTFEIARNMGLPENVLAGATELIGSEHTRFDKNLREIARDRRYWERKRQNIRQSERELNETLEKYQDELDKLKKERKKILGELKDNSGEILSQINQKIENTIREIRENQADKEKSKEARKKLDKFKLEAADQIKKMESDGDRLTERFKKERGILEKKFTIDKPSEVEKLSQNQTGHFVAGQKIKWADRDMYGEVIEYRNNNLLVRVGQMVTTTRADQVHVVSEEEYSNQTGIKGSVGGFGGYDLEMKRLNFSPQIDLRGMRAEEALQQVAEFIDEAIMVGQSDLRILHGKGDGILRQLVREYLSGIDVVEKYFDEDVRVGGTGVTVVSLQY